ncbi:hypothetical protein [Paenibacillus xylaniclasticus]|uniref:hypothetical protein n=1 Tax=Paenibacillus xylaniclasticus TaxID=588083 RepID=UPI000FDAD5AE|nr:MULTISPECIES: hypothetical protein [Paenibacillus]
MNARVDKDVVMDRFLQDHVLDKWEPDLIVIQNQLAERETEIIGSFKQSFAKLCARAAEQQREGRKGPVQYIYISMLRTSVMEDDPLYLLEAFDEQWLLDPVACTSTWRADFAFSPLFRRMQELERVKVDYARAVTSMDLDRIKQIEVVKYHWMVLEFMRDQIPSLLLMDEYKEMLKNEGLKIMAGEYRDESQLLYGAEGE